MKYPQIVSTRGKRCLGSIFADSNVGFWYGFSEPITHFEEKIFYTGIDVGQQMLEDGSIVELPLKTKIYLWFDLVNCLWKRHRIWTVVKTLIEGNLQRRNKIKNISCILL